ncbi:fibrobacter succinogenes major paralogous domain-containing protein [uncultured Fibrobacter sp.]|uniref:fibrobacter succinogenes major paralogous domain-containing protein n=1 Tax=uncultured Fibrobacter sp. TaxID=261512 RepID=UPI0025D30A20|nr:fibrobacter succinogenes major paralogous domain-containing protein [uncultured Fibrobacter sp.]
MNNPSMILYTIRAFIFAMANFALVACGGDSDSSTKPVDDGREAATVVDMGHCTNEREGDTVYVAEKMTDYLCKNHTWVDLSAVSDNEKSLPSSSVVKETMTDFRDGQTYKTVKIGTQTWMAENLNYEIANSYCNSNNVSNCTKYGRLYTWAAAMDSAGIWSVNGKGCGYGTTCSPIYPVRGVCPDGWHLPTVMEWSTLFSTVNGNSAVGKTLKSTSGWASNGNGTDTYGFSALPAGGKAGNDVFYNVYFYAYFWSAEGHYDGDAYFMKLTENNEGAILDYDSKLNAFSVRCLKNFN